MTTAAATTTTTTPDAPRPRLSRVAFALIVVAYFALITIALFGVDLLWRPRGRFRGGHGHRPAVLRVARIRLQRVARDRSPAAVEPVRLRRRAGAGEFSVRAALPAQLATLSSANDVGDQFDRRAARLARGRAHRRVVPARSGSTVACIIGGTIFALSGPYLLHLYAGHLTYLCVVAWTPLVFLAIDRILNASRCELAIPATLLGAHRRGDADSGRLSATGVLHRSWR